LLFLSYIRLHRCYVRCWRHGRKIESVLQFIWHIMVEEDSKILKRIGACTIYNAMKLSNCKPIHVLVMCADASFYTIKGPPDLNTETAIPHGSNRMLKLF
jgi:hypothetical protein